MYIDSTLFSLKMSKFYTSGRLAMVRLDSMRCYYHISVRLGIGQRFGIHNVTQL